MYVDEDTRERLAPALDDLSGLIESLDDLNYVLLTLALRCLMGADPDDETVRQTIATSFFMSGLEFFRRFIAPNNDLKLDEHGDVE